MEAQQNGMQKPELQELPVIGDRASFLYLEHCRISREDGAVTARDEEGTVHIPAASVSVLLLGPGTDVSHRAIFAKTHLIERMVRDIKQLLDTDNTEEKEPLYLWDDKKGSAEYGISYGKGGME